MPVTPSQVDCAGITSHPAGSITEYLYSGEVKSVGAGYGVFVSAGVLAGEADPARVLGGLDLAAEVQPDITSVATKAAVDHCRGNELIASSGWGRSTWAGSLTFDQQL